MGVHVTYLGSMADVFIHGTFAAVRPVFNAEAFLQPCRQTRLEQWRNRNAKILVHDDYRNVYITLNCHQKATFAPKHEQQKLLFGGHYVAWKRLI
jgi:hypothetical protein